MFDRDGDRKRNGGRLILKGQDQSESEAGNQTGDVVIGV